MDDKSNKIIANFYLTQTIWKRNSVISTKYAIIK